MPMFTRSYTRSCASQVFSFRGLEISMRLPSGSRSIDPRPVKMTKNFLINSGFFPVIALGILMFRELEIADTLAYRPKLQDRTGEDFILGRLSIEETSYGDIWM